MLKILVHLENQLKLHQECERLRMVQCNRQRLIYCYANRYDLSDLDLPLLVQCLDAITKRQYRIAYSLDSKFSSFVFNLVNKCAPQIAQRKHI